jgi:hypothetical protein
MPKSEMANLDSEINEFLKSIPDLEKEILKNNLEYDGSLAAESSLPPVRSGHEPIVVSGSGEEKDKIGLTVSVIQSANIWSMKWTEFYAIASRKPNRPVQSRRRHPSQETTVSGRSWKRNSKPN